jgi:iron complex transport system substrate-binding protein
MKKNIYLVLLLLFFYCSAEKQQANKEIRIVSLAPNITEIIYALKLEDRLVAVSDYCTYPPQVIKKEKVGGLFNPNLEKITSLKPTLVLATKSNQQLKEKISRPGIKVVLLPEKSVSDLYFSIDSIAILNGVQNRAKALISSIQDSLKKYTVKDTQNRPTAILVLGRDPGTTNNIGLCGPGAFINELWQDCGGLNAFPDMPGSFSQVNREDVLQRNPNIIIEFKTSKGWTDDKLQENKREWHDLQIDAVKNGNIFVVQGVGFLVPGPRIYLLAKEYFNILGIYRSSEPSG